MKRLCLLASLLLAGTANAQGYGTNFTTGILFPVVMNPCPGGKCPGVVDRPGPARPPANAARPDRASAAPVSLTFTPDAARRKANLVRFVAASNGDPAMRQLAAQADSIFPQLAASMKNLGLNANDVGDAYAAWWVSAYDAAHGNTGTRSAVTYRAVKKQAAAAVLATPKLRGAGPQLRQEMAEALLVQVVLIDVSVEHAKADPAQIKAVGQAVAQGARKMGVDLDAMTLTEGGFTAR